MILLDFQVFSPISLIQKGCVGVTYEKNPPVHQYRDTVTFYRDGRMHFVRYCYGESAGPIADMWSIGKIGENGEIEWDYDSTYYSKKESAPKRLCATDDIGELYFDDQPYSWSKMKDLKTDPDNGYSWLKTLFIK